MSIFFDNSNNTFYLESAELSYVIKIDKFGFLEHLYYGARIARDDLEYSIFRTARGHSAYLAEMGRENTFEVLSQEFPTYGRGDFRECAFAFDNNGVRVGDFKYKSHIISEKKPELSGMPSVKGDETLVITLCDDLNNIEIDLYYTVCEDLPVILRHNEIRNCGNNEIIIDRAYSFSLDLPDDDFEFISLYGAHLRERYIQRNRLHHGVVSVDSKYGVSSSQLNPFAALARPNADEERGEVYGFNLVYSGNFVIKAQVGQNDVARVIGGINDFDFAWTLGSGESFVTPEAVMVYSNEGLGKMSRAFHDLYRKYLINPRFVNESRPIVLNSWEAVYYDYDENKLCELIEAIKGTGIDTFVLDDGWFGNRNDELTGLGDWYPNTEKLPRGLKPIIDCTHENGLKFGLWFEPEMVIRDSDLYREHPDWIIHVDGLEPCQGRFQYVLDLTREDVRDHIVDIVSKCLKENDIDYVKWDMNRSLTENYSAHLEKREKEFAHRYVLGLYDICERIINGFPNIFFEGCASGGCRFDPAMLYYFPQIWTSDNTDALARCAIQYGTSLCYPLSSMSCHVSVCPNHQNGRVTEFKSRTDIASLGATGYELDPRSFTKEELVSIKADTRAHKVREKLILDGDLYRLSYPDNDKAFAEQIVSKDQKESYIVIMRALCKANDTAHRIYPRGLCNDMIYRIEELDGLTLYGSTIMNVGLLINFEQGDFKTVVLTIRSVE